MKERITYIVKDAVQGYDPSNIDIAKQRLTITGLDGAKEHQITFGLHELPAEIHELLTSSHELHVRWSSPRPYQADPPYVSRVSSGLHVFFSPLKNEQLPPLCQFLKKAFGQDLKCDDIKRSSTTPQMTSGRFAHTASHQLYDYVPSLESFMQYATDSICPPSSGDCESRAQELLLADYLDMDYDSISHTLILKAFWSRPHSSDSQWHETHHLSSSDSAVEVGVLLNENPDEAEELKYSGFLTQIGKDSQASPVLFSFPSRHHPLPVSSSFATSFDKPTGLHPTLRVTLASDAATTTPAAHCQLHAYLTLPSTLFIDQYPLSDPLFLASHNLKALHTLSGATDLEAPDYLTTQWGSAALFEIDTSATPTTGDFAFTIPLHLRYLSPANGTQGIRNALIPDPVLFWACPAEEYGKFSSSPFDRVNLGYDGLFGPKTYFYHFPPSASATDGELVRQIKVPVLDLDKAWYVEWGTAISVLFGALLVAVPLIALLSREFGQRWTALRNRKRTKEDTKIN